MKSKKNLAFGMAVAAGVGYAVGILTAPKSGKETREDIKKGALAAKLKLEAKLKELYSEAGVLITTSKDKLSTLSGKAKTELSSAVSAAQQARDKAKVVLSALHEGEADDADLDKAVKDLKTALDSLKTYASK